MKMFRSALLGPLLLNSSMSAPSSSSVSRFEKLPSTNHQSHGIDESPKFFTAGRQVKEANFKDKNDVNDAIMEIHSGGAPTSSLTVEDSISRAGFNITSGGTEVFEIVTTYEGGWKQDGVMFDVRTVVIGANEDGAEGITILGFDVLTPTENELVCVEIYTKEGSLTENNPDQSPDQWTFLGSISVIGQGKNSPTHIPIGSFDPSYLGINATRAFYITTQDENLRYTALDSDEGETVTGDVFSREEHSFTRSDGSSHGFGVEILTGVAKNYVSFMITKNRLVLI